MYILYYTKIEFNILFPVNGKKNSKQITVLFREGISFLWGIAKNYIMYWGGYEYYNSIPMGF